MVSMRSGLFAWLAIGFILLTWTEGRAQPTVYVVNYPLQYFAERIAGDRVKVVFPAPADGDPAFWKPDLDAIAAYQAADLILINGAGYAKWLKTVSLPKSKMIDSSGRFQAEYIAVEDTGVHSHGPTGEHSHAGTAFTTWLDLRQAAQQAQAVLEGLSRLLPEHQEAFQQRYAELERDLLALDERLDAMVAQRRTQHPCRQRARPVRPHRALRFHPPGAAHRPDDPRQAARRGHGVACRPGIRAGHRLAPAHA